MPSQDDPLTWAVCLEELAAGSGGAAVEVAASSIAPTSERGGATWPGLRGANLGHARVALAGSDIGSLSASVVLVGLARAAIDLTLSELRVKRARGVMVEQTQWPVSDAATALDAGRLMVWHAAQAVRHQGGAASSLAKARLLSVEAAQLALAAARHASSPEAFATGAPLERIARDIDTALLLFGGAETWEAAIAPVVRPA